MTQFYELQLILLTGFCISSLLLERYASKQKHSLTPKENRDSSVENGQGHNVSTSNPGGLATLTRKYLVVYAIVMGELQFGLWFLVSLITCLKAPIGSKGHICTRCIENSTDFPKQPSLFFS
jgi:hypothetical protein